MEKTGLKHIGRNAGRIMKGAAALIAAAAFVVASSVTPPPEHPQSMNSEIFSPPPVVMTVEEVPEAIVEEAGETEEVKKKGFFFKVKMAVYGFFAACGAWLAHKIPWKKIFNRRNLYILLALICIGLAIHFLWPVITEQIARVQQVQ